MTLGVLRHHHAAAVRVLATLVLSAILVTACGPGADHPAVTPSAADPVPPAPFALTRDRTGHELGSIVRTLPGLHGRVSTCPGRGTCSAVPAERWLISARRAGAPIEHGNGFSTAAYLAVAAFRTPTAARHFVRTVRDRSRVYGTKFDIPLWSGPGREYTPRETGVGVLVDVAHGRWHGWRLEMRHAFSFYDGTWSGDEYTRRTLASRGRFVAGAYLDAASPDELARLAKAWRQLLARLEAG